MMSDPDTPTGPRAPPPTPEVITFSAKESQTLLAAWGALKAAPEIDLKKLTQLGGFNTEKTASNTWCVIKKKLAKIVSGEGIVTSNPFTSATGTSSPAKGSGTSGPGSSTPTRGGGAGERKRKAPAGNTAEDDMAEPATPSPKKRARKVPSKVKQEVKQEDEEAVKQEDEEEMEMNAGLGASDAAED